MKALSKFLVNSLYQVDQCVRKSKLFSIVTVRTIDSVSTVVLKELIKRCGAPALEDLGVTSAEKFLILLAHSIDLDFVKDLMQSEGFRRSGYKEQDVGILIDRVLIDAGKKQKYGTIVETKEDARGDLITKPLPIEDETNVDKRRQKIGLPPMADYLKASENLYKKYLRGKRWK